MKLYQLLIDNQLVDLSVAYTPEQINNRLAFVALLDNQTPPTDYQDVSSIENWHNYWKYVEGQFGCKDWKSLRREIWALVAPIVGVDWSGWDTLTEQEKYLACYYLPNKVPLTLFIATVTNPLDRANISINFDLLSQEARDQRIKAARPFVFSNLPIGDCIKLIDKTYLLNIKYVQGVEDKASDGVEGLFDYLTSAANTSYENNGFLEENFTPYVLTLQQISDKLITIMKDGYY
jgi:hypothetical protein